VFRPIKSAQKRFNLHKAVPFKRTRPPDGRLRSERKKKRRGETPRRDGARRSVWVRVPTATDHETCSPDHKLFFFIPTTGSLIPSRTELNPITPYSNWLLPQISLPRRLIAGLNGTKAWDLPKYLMIMLVFTSVYYNLPVKGSHA